MNKETNFINDNIYYKKLFSFQKPNEYNIEDIIKYTDIKIKINEKEKLEKESWMLVKEEPKNDYDNSYITNIYNIIYNCIFSLREYVNYLVL